MENLFSINHMCHLLGIDNPDEHWENHIGPNCECQTKGEKYFDSLKNETFIAEEDYVCSLCQLDYPRKVIDFFDKLIAKFDLELRTARRSNTEGDQWALVPKKSWHQSSKELIEVINGVGLFGFSSVKEGIRAGPYKSAKDFFLNHIGWIGSYWEVYEGSKCSNVFDRFIYGRSF